MRNKKLFLYSIVIDTNELVDMVNIKPGRDAPKTYTEVIELLERAKQIMQEKKIANGDKID